MKNAGNIQTQPERSGRGTRAGYYSAALSADVMAAGYVLGALPGLVIATELVCLSLLGAMIWIGVGR